MSVTAGKLKSSGVTGDAYDILVQRLMEEYMRMKKIDVFVEAQHKIAKEGKFAEPL
jgi:hypothetical protein